MNKKTALVLGAGGFIGSHMVKRLRSEGYWVRGVDIKYPDFTMSAADEFIIGDLREVRLVARVLDIHEDSFDEIYQFAADMGGAGYIFTDEHSADIMHNSASINLNVLNEQVALNKLLGVNKTKIFYSSSACMYPEHNQLDPDNPDCRESSAYPANPDSEYGWEKLFSERLYLAYNRNYDIPVCVARYHNIFGTQKEHGMEEKKRLQQLSAARSHYSQKWEERLRCGVMSLQTRSFLFIDECIEATRRLMTSTFQGPVNIGSEEMVTINQLVETAAKVSGKVVTKMHKLDAPLGVRGRNSNNDLVREKLGWDYSQTLEEGIAKTYAWISEQIKSRQHGVVEITSKELEHAESI